MPRDKKRKLEKLSDLKILTVFDKSKLTPIVNIRKIDPNFINLIKCDCKPGNIGSFKAINTSETVCYLKVFSAIKAKILPNPTSLKNIARQFALFPKYEFIKVFIRIEMLFRFIF